MTKITLVFLAAITLIWSGQAAPLTFDFKDPKGVNNAAFRLDATLEAINGTANGVSGTVRFEPEDPASVSGKIVVAADSLRVPNPVMQGHLLGKDWMDVAKHKEISFEAVKAANVKQSGNETTADVIGRLSLHGVTKDITAPVKFTYLKGKLGARTMGRMQGDLLVIRSRFTIKRSDFSINPKAPEQNVSEEVELVLSLAGAAPTK